MDEAKNQSLKVPGQSRENNRVYARLPKGMDSLRHGALRYIAGLADYRAGRYRQSIERLKEAATDTGWNCAGHQLPCPGDGLSASWTDQAVLEALGSAERQINQWTDEMLERPVGTMPIPWFDWIECLYLYREAHGARDRLCITRGLPAQGNRATRCRSPRPAVSGEQKASPLWGRHSSAACPRTALLERAATSPERWTADAATPPARLRHRQPIPEPQPRVRVPARSYQ